MGSITRKQKLDKRTGKPVTVFRAYVRRQGYASKSKVCTTEREAKEWLRENEATVTLSKATNGKTFAQLVEEFVVAPPSKGTKFWAAPHLDFWKAALGSMKVADISRGDINSAKSKLLSQPAMRSTPAGPITTTARLSAGTVNRYLASLSSVFNFAMDRELIDAHPMKGGKVRKLKETGGRTRILNDDEEQRLYEAARRSDWPMLYLLVRMALTTAARRGELLSLRWSDLRLDDSIAVITKTKNEQPRSLPLVSDVKQALVEAKKVRPLRSDLIFYDPKNPERAKNIDTVWKRCRADAGLLADREDPLDRVVLHSTRHSAVTKMLKGGANLAQAAVVSGHKTLAMLKRYEHLSAADSVDLAEKLLAGKKD